MSVRDTFLTVRNTLNCSSEISTSSLNHDRANCVRIFIFKTVPKFEFVSFDFITLALPRISFKSGYFYNL